MNYIYGEPKLNIKKVVIALIILLLLLVLSIVLIFSSRKDSNYTILEKDKTFFIDNNFNITFSKDLKVEQTESQNEFLLELHSKNDLNFYISKIEGFDSEDFLKVAKSDYFYYLQNFENKSDISDLMECNVKDFPGYTYSFKYVDSNTAFYLCVYILKINNNIYTFNIQIPIENLITMVQNINIIMNSISIV